MTKNYLLYLFDYNRENGQLFWKNHYYYPTSVKMNGKKVDTIREDKCGIKYVNVMIKGKTYLVHRLIWFIENETWPEQVDHIDGNGLNNKIQNLRSSSQRLNQRNRNIHRKGRLFNVYFCKTTNRWRAQFTIKGKRIHVGRFDTEIEAHLASVAELEKRGL